MPPAFLLLLLHGKESVKTFSFLAKNFFTGLYSLSPFARIHFDYNISEAGANPLLKCCASGGWRACAVDYVSKADAHAAARMPVAFLKLIIRRILS